MELTREQQLALVRSFVHDNFVVAGMCADFALHDKGNGNPHAHILLTIRPLKESGEWGAKCRKVYYLDEHGQRISDGKGGWKNHREDTTDWNDKGKAEVWRAAWADYANKALEAAGRPERIDHRISALSEHFSMWEQYQKYKTVHKQYAKIKQGKRELFEERHHAELALYAAAERYLNKLKSGGEPLTPKKWQTDISALIAKKDLGYKDMRAMREQLKAVETLKKLLRSWQRNSRARAGKRRRRNYEHSKTAV